MAKNMRGSTSSRVRSPRSRLTVPSFCTLARKGGEGEPNGALHHAAALVGGDAAEGRGLGGREAGAEHAHQAAHHRLLPQDEAAAVHQAHRLPARLQRPGHPPSWPQHQARDGRGEEGLWESERRRRVGSELLKVEDGGEVGRPGDGHPAKIPTPTAGKQVIVDKVGLSKPRHSAFRSDSKEARN